MDRAETGGTVTRSEFEIEFLAFLDAHHLERPLVDERIGPHTIDAVWPVQRLAVELDSRQAHATTKAFEDDRARDRRLVTEGSRVVRITDRQLHEDEATIAAQLRALTDTVGPP